MYEALCYVLDYKDGKTPVYPKPQEIFVFGTKEVLRDFPGGPVVKTLHFHFRG